MVEEYKRQKVMEHIIKMKKNYLLSLLLLSYLVVYTSGCTALGNNQVMRVLAANPKNSVAVAFVNYANVQNQRLKEVLAKNPESISESEAIECAEYYEYSKVYKAAIFYRIVSAEKGDESGFKKAGDLCADLKQYREAYSLYYAAISRGDYSKDILEDVEKNVGDYDKKDIAKYTELNYLQVKAWAADANYSQILFAKRNPYNFTPGEARKAGFIMMKNKEIDSATLMYLICGVNGDPFGYYMVGILGRKVDESKYITMVCFSASEGCELAKKEWDKIKPTLSESEISKIQSQIPQIKSLLQKKMKELSENFKN